MILLFLKADSIEKLIGTLIVMTIIVAGLIIYLVLKGRRNQSRAKALGLIARQLGWSFTPILSDEEFVSQYRDSFHLTDKKVYGDRYISFHNVIREQVNDADVTLFHYHYSQTARGSLGSSYEQTMVHVRSPKLRLPGFYPLPTVSQTGEAIGRALGVEPDINFTYNPGFSARYSLRGQDEQGIRRSFNSALSSFYEQTEGATTRDFGNEFIYYRNAKKFRLKIYALFLMKH